MSAFVPSIAISRKALKGVVSLAKAAHKDWVDGPHSVTVPFFVSLSAKEGGRTVEVALGGSGLFVSVAIPCDVKASVNVRYVFEDFAKVVSKIPASGKPVEIDANGAIRAGNMTVSPEQDEDDGIPFDMDMDLPLAFPALPFGLFSKGVKRVAGFRCTSKQGTGSHYHLGGITFSNAVSENLTPAMIATDRRDLSHFMFDGLACKTDFMLERKDVMLNTSGTTALHALMKLTERLSIGDGEVRVAWDVENKVMGIRGTCFTLFAPVIVSPIGYNTVLRQYIVRPEYHSVSIGLDKKILEETAKAIYGFAGPDDLMKKPESNEPYCVLSIELDSDEPHIFIPKEGEPASKGKVQGTLTLAKGYRKPSESSDFMKIAASNGHTIRNPGVSSISVQNICATLACKDVELEFFYDDRIVNSLHTRKGSGSFGCNTLCAKETGRGFTNRVIAMGVYIKE